MSLEPSYNDTVDMRFSVQNPLGRMVKDGNIDELASLMAQAKDSGVTLKLYRRKDGAVLARASVDGFFHGSSYGFIDMLYYNYKAAWAGYGMLRELFKPENHGYRLVSTKPAMTLS